MRSSSKPGCGSRILVRVLLVTASLVGCGDDDPDTAEDKCRRLASTYCKRQSTCLKETGSSTDSELKTARESCERDFTSSAMCSLATDVRSTYSACLDLLEIGPCERVLSTSGYVPDACMDVITR